MGKLPPGSRGGVRYQMSDTGWVTGNSQRPNEKDNHGITGHYLLKVLSWDG